MDLSFGNSGDRFGHADYWGNLDRGRTISEIKRYLDANMNRLSSNNLPGRGGLYDMVAKGANTWIGQYGGDERTMRGTGMEAINRALAQGMTLNQIRSRVSNEGLSWGQGAQNYFSTRPESAFISEYGGNEESFRNAGIDAVNRALSAGLTPAQIEERGRNENITWGEKASAYLSSDRANRDRISDLSGQLGEQTRRNDDLAKRYNDLDKKYQGQINDLNQSLLAARNTYRESSTVGTSSKLGGFNPNQAGTPMSIKQQGTGRFNRKNRNRAMRANTLQISNLNL